MYRGPLVTVYKRGAHYHARYKVAGGTGTERKSLRTGDQTVADVRAKELEAKLLRIEAGAPVTLLEREESLDALYQGYLAHLRDRGSPTNTVKAVTVAWDKGPRAEGWKAQAQVTDLAIDHWLRRRGAQVTGQTVNCQVALLRSLWGWAVRQGKAQVNPWARVASLKTTTKRNRRDLTPDEVSRLSTAPHGLRWLIYGLTGMRAEVGSRLEWGWINWGERTLSIPPELNKRGVALTLPLAKPLEDALKAWYPECECKPLVLPRYDRTTIYRQLLSDCEGLGIDTEGTCLHSLRHGYATQLYRATRDILLVSRMLGHKSIATTQAYLHTEVADMRGAIDTVASAISTQATVGGA